MPEAGPEPDPERGDAAGAPAPRRAGYRAGVPFAWWGTLLLPFLGAFWFLYGAAKDRVNWKAAFATVLLFEIVVFPAEIFSVWRGHWVYNDARIWGPRLFNVPIEEPLLYYVFPALITITAFHAIRMRFE